MNNSNINAEAPTHLAEGPMAIEPVAAADLPADFFDGTVALDRGLVGSPETGYGTVVDFMNEGYAIQRDPQPIATTIIDAPTPETVLDSIVESPDSEDEPQEPRFQPYTQHIEQDAQDSTPTQDTTQPEQAGLGKNLLQAVRRSRVGKLAAVTALAASELLSLGTAHAQATNLTPEEVQACTDAAVAHPAVPNKPAIYRAGLRGKQTLRGTLEYEGLPDYCSPEYMRVGSGQFEIREHGRWVKVGPVTTGGAWGNQGARYGVEYSPSHTPGPAYIYDECIGGKFEKAWLVLTESLRTGENRHRTTVAQKRYIMPLEANGSCQAAVRSRKRYHQ